MNTSDYIEILPSCNYAKMLLMVCIIIYHSCMFWTDSWFSVGQPAEYNEQLAHFAYWLATFHVPTFVLISGFIYSHIVNEKKGYSKPSEFLCKKVKRLLMPYFAITILWLIPFALVLSSYTFKEIIVKYVLVGGEQLWFLYMLFGVFLLFHFVVRNNKKIYEMLMVFGCYIIGLLLSFKGINYFQIASSLQYLLFFWIGYRLRIVMNKNTENQQFIIVGGGNLICQNRCSLILLIVHISIYLLSTHISDAILLLVMNFILRIAGSLIAFVVFVKLGYVLYAKQSKIINSIMKHNFEMFLFHQQIIYVCLLSLNGILPPAIHAIFNFIISFILSYAISVGISKTKYLSKVIKKKNILNIKKNTKIECV